MADSEKIHSLINLIQLNEGGLYMPAWIKDTRDLDEDEEELYDTISCGFVACAAGWTLIDDGWIPKFDTLNADWGFEKNGEYIPNGERVGMVAAEILDIPSPMDCGLHLFSQTGWDVDRVTTCLKYLGEQEEMRDAIKMTAADFEESVYRM